MKIEQRHSKRRKDGTGEFLDSWLLRHSLAMLLAAVVAVPLRSAAPVVLTAAVSVALLGYGSRGELAGLTPFGGYPNLVTTLRLVLILSAGALLTVAPHGLILALLATNVALDMLDGFVARRKEQVTRLGGTFDGETDAIFVLIAYLYFLLADGIGAWILVPGVLPYAYRLAMRALDGPGFRQERQQLAAILAGINYVVLLAALSAAPPLRPPLLGLSLIIVLSSFCVSFLRHWRHAAPASL